MNEQEARNMLIYAFIKELIDTVTLVPLREYLQVVLRSTVGKLQMERPTTGTSYPTITDADVENIQIPILPRSMQEKIAELVRQSHESRKKAKALLEEAKHKVEELIETRR